MIDVIAVATDKGKHIYTSTTEKNASAQTLPGEKPKGAKKARVAPKGAKVAKKKGRSGKKAAPAKKVPKGAKKPSVREGSKTDQVLELLKRPGGVTAQGLVRATGWQPHSVRGFLSGTIGKKMGLAVTSVKSEDSERTYSIKV